MSRHPSALKAIAMSQTSTRSAELRRRATSFATDMVAALFINDAAVDEVFPAGLFNYGKYLEFTGRPQK